MFTDLVIQYLKKTAQYAKSFTKKSNQDIFSVKYNAHTSNLFDKSKITKVENIYEKESLIAAYKFQNKTLPTAIMDLFENSLYDNNIITRQQTSCILRPSRELNPGHLMYDILNFWNRIGSSSREERTLNGFKKKITSMLNSYSECVKENCYSCN